jgi:dTDP-4-dehydrorhamnose reductase
VRVAIFGAGGQLGCTTVARWQTNHDVTPLTRGEVDLRSSGAVERAIDSVAPHLVLNCAAYTNVDGAEDDPLAALEVNALAVRAMATASERRGAILVHYSTDFVFDGRASSPYAEEAEPRPQSVYGASKLLGEWFTAGAARHYVLRVESLFGGPRAQSSIDRIVAALRAGRPARVFVDRVVTPSFVDDVAWATARLVDGSAPPGLYHCVNSGETTWYDVGREIAALLGRSAALLEPVKVADVPLRAERPQYCALSNARLREAGAAMPTWQDALQRYLARSDAVSGAE